MDDNANNSSRIEMMECCEVACVSSSLSANTDKFHGLPESPRPTAVCHTRRNFRSKSLIQPLIIDARSPKNNKRRHSLHGLPASFILCDCDSNGKVEIRINGVPSMDHEDSVENPTVPAVRKRVPLAATNRQRSVSMPIFDRDAVKAGRAMVGEEEFADYDDICSSRELRLGSEGDIAEEQDSHHPNESFDIALIKSLSTPEIASDDAPSSPCSFTDDPISPTSVTDSFSLPSHIFLGQLLAEFQRNRGLDARDAANCTIDLANHGQQITLCEALKDPTINGHLDQPDVSVRAAATSSPLPSFLRNVRKDRKDRIKRTSKIFGIGVSRNKRDKDEISRCQRTHHFVSVSYSNQALCQICGKSLANKSASQCQNCHLTCHDHQCLDQIDACPVAKKLPRPTMRSGSLSSVISSSTASTIAASLSPAVTLSLNSNGSPTQSTTSIDKITSAAGGYPPANMPDVVSLGLALDPKLQPLKRLSVPSSFEHQVFQQSPAESVSLSNRSSPAASPTSTLSKRPQSPAFGKASRWKYVAEKLLNKQSSDKETELDSATPVADDGAVVENPDVKDVLPYARLLDFDPDLKLATPEPEAWSMTQDREFLTSIGEREVKRQDIIHELIQTEKNHCAVLLIIDQIYIRGLRHELQWQETDIHKFFPCFGDILDVHLKFFRQLRQRQQQGRLVLNIGDILIDQFDGERGVRMKNAYGVFCSHHKDAGQIYKAKLAKDRRFAAFDSKCVEKLKCHSSRFDIPSCILLVTQRISKYRLLIESILQKTDAASADHPLISRAFDHVKEVLTFVDGSIGAEERRKRLAGIYRSLDPKSYTVLNDKEWKKHALYEEGRSLLMDGPVQVRRSSNKLADIQVLLMTDCMVFLQENNQKFVFANIDGKPAVIMLNKLILRPKAERSGIPEKSLFLISQEKRVEMYELVCATLKECEKWRNEINAACNALRAKEESPTSTGKDEERSEEEKALTLLRMKIEEFLVACQEKDGKIRKICQEKCELMLDAIDSAQIPRTRMHLPPFLNISEANPGFEQLQTTVKMAISELNKLMPGEVTNGHPDAFVDSSSGNKSPTITLQNVQSSPADMTTGANTRRAETFGGFDGMKDHSSSAASRSISMKEPPRSRLNAGVGSAYPSSASLKSAPTSGLGNSLTLSRDSGTDGSTSSVLSSSSTSSPRVSGSFSELTMTDASSAIIQVNWYLNQLMDGMARQYSAYQNLHMQYLEAQTKLAALESQEKKRNKHSAQIEELRALQEAFLKEKNQYLLEKETDNQWMKQKRQELEKEAARLKEKSDDVDRQRDALFQQCEKLKQHGLDIVLSNQAPYAQIFRQDPPSNSHEDKLSHHTLSPPHHSSLIRPLPPLPSHAQPSYPSDHNHRPRPVLGSSVSQGAMRIPTVPPVPVMSAAKYSNLAPVATEPMPKESSGWRGSMESLARRAEQARDKMRGLTDSGVDRTDSLPRNASRMGNVAGESKLGIGNLMHLSEKISPSDAKKKSSLDKKRSFL